MKKIAATFLITAVLVSLPWYVLRRLEPSTERVWIKSSIIAPMRMALTEIERDFEEGRHRLAAQKMEALRKAWTSLEDDPGAMRRNGIGNILHVFYALENTDAIKNPPATPSGGAECLANMKQLESALEQWTTEKANQTSVAKPSDLIGTNLFMKKMPKCPKGGSYKWTQDPETVACDIHGSLTDVILQLQLENQPASP